MIEENMLENEIGAEGLKVVAKSEGMPDTPGFKRTPVETNKPTKEPANPENPAKGEEPAKEPASQNTEESAKEPAKTTEPSKAEEPAKEPTSQEPAKPEPTKPAEPQFSKTDFLKEISGGKFNSPQDLKNYLDKAVVPTDERVKGLVEYIEAGGKFENYANIQMQDFSKMSAEEVVKYKMKIENSSLSNKDIDLLYNKKYSILPEKDEEGNNIDENIEANKVTQIEIKQEAEKSRAHLNELKKQAPDKPPAPKNQGPSAEELAQINKEWIDGIEAEIGEFKNIKMELAGENDKKIELDYNVNETGIQKIRSIINEPSKFWNRFMKQDGTVDMNKMFKYFYIAENFDTIASAIATQSDTKGQETILKEIKNPSQQVEAKKTVVEKVPVEQQAADILLNS